jgi:hypothetical protein
MMMVFGLVTMVGCPADSDSGSKNEEEQKVVAEQYRGTFASTTNSLEIILTKNTYQQPPNSPDAAYTDGEKLWVARGGEFRYEGSFQDADTFNPDDDPNFTYKRK